jgi:hypothetical protein
MITATDLIKHIELKNSDKSKLIDDWLQSTVFPKWSRNGDGFTTPKGISNSEIENLLNVRGFVVTTHSSYQGNFVYISLPPQND